MKKRLNGDKEMNLERQRLERALLERIRVTGSILLSTRKTWNQLCNLCVP